MKVPCRKDELEGGRLWDCMCVWKCYVATLLVERGADSAAVNTCIGGTTLLLFAAGNRISTQCGFVSSAAPRATTILYEACKNGHAEAVRLLLDNGAELIATKDGVTPLSIACKNGHIDAALLLLEWRKGVDKRTRTAGRCCTCTRRPMADAARLLLEKGAEVDRGRGRAGRRCSPLP